MKFGKVANFEDIDFVMPADPGVTRSFLNGLSNKENGKVFIGCTGWSMKEWIGKVYPPDAKSNQFLRYYGRQFNCIELNTTHYRIPDDSTIEKWYRETPEDFRFCPKIPQIISHSKNLGLGSPRPLEFWEAIAGLEEKLGLCFMQLPPYFTVEKLPLLEQFLKKVPSHIPLAVEFRHESWFANGSLAGKAHDLLKSRRMPAVITDVAGRRDVLHMCLSAPEVIIRFVGNGLHSTDYRRINDWVDRLERWLASGLETVYFFPHEPDNLLAPELSVYLAEKLGKLANIKTRGPNLLESPGEQGSLF